MWLVLRAQRLRAHHLGCDKGPGAHRKAEPRQCRLLAQPGLAGLLGAGVRGGGLGRLQALKPGAGSGLEAQLIPGMVGVVCRRLVAEVFVEQPQPECFDRERLIGVEQVEGWDLGAACLEEAMRDGLRGALVALDLACLVERGLRAAGLR